MPKESSEKSNYWVSLFWIFKRNFCCCEIEFFDHENIIGLVDVAKPPAKTGFEDIYIITDLMETDMHRVIYSRQDLTDDHC